MKSIYDIEMNSAEDQPNFLQQFKGKVVLFVNTTVVVEMLISLKL